MAFFDDLGKKISQTTQNAVQKTKDMGDIAKINSAISEEEKKIAEIYSELGRTYITLHKNNPEEGKISDLVLAFAEAETNIEIYKNRINEIKGIKTCRKCGAVISANAAFCSSCGSSTAETEPQPQLEATAFCSNCGAPLSDEMQFCTSCGTQITKKEIAEETPAVEDAPTIEEPPVIEETPVIENNDATEEIPVVEEIPAYMLDPSQKVEVETKAVEIPAEPATKFCTNCGQQIKATAIFCTNCGIKFDTEKPKKTCPNCSTESAEGMLFCTNCGTKL